ncbi:MAG: nucleotidyl transferase AbiEii/AbiGii toxin family protein, partial [Rhodothermaceae bacterium]
MKLHSDAKLFQQAVRATAEKKGISDIYIEKDYWVTFVLYTIFSNKVGEDTVFKGGTALSKCYGLIDRFSEDVDLVVRKNGLESNNQLKRKIKKVSKVVNNVLPEQELEGVTHKKGMRRKTVHPYKKEFKGDFGQIRDVIIVEATSLGNHEPYTTKMISSYIFEMMEETKQRDIAEEMNLLPFEVQVLEPKRTMCEKIMSLVRFSYEENPVESLKNKIRHTYDLYKILLDSKLKEFFNSEKFDEMLLRVANDDVMSFKGNNKWLANHPQNSFIFDEPEKVWPELKDI